MNNNIIISEGEGSVGVPARPIPDLTFPLAWPINAIGEGGGFFPIRVEGMFGRDGDPLAQTFMIDSSSFAGEPTGFLTSLDLFFSSKDANMGVVVELREVVNGSPGAKVLPFSKVHLKSSQVNTSTKGTVATTINFKAPVAITTNKEYCFVILPDGNSPEYKVFTAKAGQKDLNTNISVNQDWGTGTMFLSTNNRTWTEYLDEDAKFTLRQAVFKDNLSTVDLVNEDYEFLVANNGLINGTFHQGEEVFKQAANATGNVAIEAGNNIIVGDGTNFTSPALAAGDKIVLTGSSTTFDVVEINSVSNTTHLTLRGAPKFTDATGNYKFTPVGEFVSLDGPTNTLLIEGSTSTNSTFLYEDQDVIIGCDSNANTTIDAPVNTNISYHEPRFYNFSVADTAIRLSLIHI